MAHRNTFAKRFAEGLRPVLGFQPTVQTAWKIWLVGVHVLGDTLIEDLLSRPNRIRSGALLIPKHGVFRIQQGQRGPEIEGGEALFYPRLKYETYAKQVRLWIAKHRLVRRKKPSRPYAANQMLGPTRPAKKKD
jgi:hypothetical protein